MPASKDLDTPLRSRWFMFRTRWSEKRILFGWGKARLGAWINLIIGVATLLLHGGVGGTESILAIVSGVLGLLAA